MAELPSQTKWVGWGVFAAVLILLSGAINGLYGLAAIIGPNSAYFALLGTGKLLVLDVAGWGWWHLIIGIFLVIVSFALLAGSTWARVVAIVLVALNAISQLGLLPAQPWLSLIVLVINLLVLYALIVHGRELKTRAAA